MKKYISILALFLSILEGSLSTFISLSFADDEYEVEDSYQNEQRHHRKDYTRFHEISEDNTSQTDSVVSNISNSINTLPVVKESSSAPIVNQPSVIKEVTPASHKAVPVPSTPKKKSIPQLKNNLISYASSSNSTPVKPVSSFIAPNGKIFSIIYNSLNSEYSYLENGNVSAMHSPSKAEIIASLNLNNSAISHEQLTLENFVPETSSSEYSKAVALAEAQIQEIHTKAPAKAFAFERPSTPEQFLVGGTETSLGAKVSATLEKFLAKKAASQVKQAILQPKIATTPKKTTQVVVQKPVQKTTPPVVKKPNPVIVKQPTTPVVKKPTPVVVTPKPTPVVAPTPVVVTPPVVNLPSPSTSTRAS